MSDIDQFRFEVTPWIYGGHQQVEWRVYVESNGRKYHYTQLMPRTRLHTTELEVYIRAAVQEFRKIDADA